MKLLFLFFLLPISGFSQQIELGHLDSIQNFSLDNTNKQFYIFFKHRYDKLDLLTFERISKQVNIPADFNF